MLRRRDVAIRSDVSVSTASRALTRPDMVASQTVERVKRAAKELGYQPNLLARSLRTRVTRLIGLLVSDILNPFHATLAKGLQDAAFDHGYSLLLCNTDEDPDKELTYLRLFRTHQLRGFVVVPTENSAGLLSAIGELPVVEADRTSGLPGFHAVLADNQEGTEAAISHLIAFGHRRVAIIAGKLSITSGSERLSAYLGAMERAGLPVDPGWIVHGDHREQGGYLAARALLSLPPERQPSAWFVINNEMTAGAVRAILEAGLQIPRDLSLIGFDDSRWAQLMHPPLTVIEQSPYDMGYTAGKILFDLFERGPTPPGVLRLATRLLERASVAAPAPAQLGS